MDKAKRYRPFFLITLAAFAFSLSLFFTSLDNKLFDLFLRLLPSLTENEKVFVLTLDDDSINLAGGFPFRREVMADVVILLKELGVETIAFDLSYLDESPYRLDPEYAAQVFDYYLDSNFSRLDEASMFVIDAIGPTTSYAERENYKEDFRYLHGAIRNELADSISYLIRDVDEYFAQALAFSNSAWLTLTMIRREDTFEFILGEAAGEDLGITDEETNKYLAEYIALENINAAKDTKTPEMVGVFPAISKLLSRARGAGFVNANPDSDGLRRRVHLLLKYNDLYYAQLTLAALQERLGYTSVEVDNKAITLIDDNDARLRIPRAQDGSVLLKWPKKIFYNYNVMSLVELVQHIIIEPELAHNIALMNDSGFFYYWDGGEEAVSQNPREYYIEAEGLKNLALVNNGVAGEDWFIARENFFASTEAFLFGHYEQMILDDVGDDVEVADFVRLLFDASRSQFSRMAQIRENAAALQDSFCVIGADATSMTDNGLITFQENFPLVGSYATVANMLLSGEFISDAPRYVSAIIALLFSLLLCFFLSHFDTHISIITGVSGLALLTGIFAGFFLISKIYIGFAVPLACSVLTFISIMAVRFLTASREKAFLHNAFSRYLAPEVISQIINDPDKLNLGGEKREMTAIFTDIKGFSSISEQLDPDQLVKLLNRYLTELSNIVMENLGTIDKYIGDAIVAFYGAPVFRPDHAALACRSALAMKKAEAELNKDIIAKGLSPVPIFTRIGINTGEMVVGNMGAENKMDYTIMGNAVNLTARLEGVNKQYHTGGILISEFTHAKAGEEFLYRRLDRVRVVGVNTPLCLYELMCLKSEADEDMWNRVTLWEEAIDNLEKGNFVSAYTIFEKLKQQYPNDGTAELYALRSESYIQDPPQHDWDGVYNLTEK